MVHPMVLLGVILVLLAAAAGVLLLAGTAQLTDTVDVEILGGTLSLPPLTLLVTGMVVISLFWLGWAMLRAGLRHGKRRRLQAKEAAAAAEAQRAEDERRLKEEVASRDRQLIEERRLREEETSRLRGEADARASEPVAPRHHEVGDDAPASRPAGGGAPRTDGPDRRV